MSTQPKNRSDILVVDDEPEICSMLGAVFADTYRCQTATDGQAALELAGQRHYDVIISDIAMPFMSGLELLDKVRTFQRSPKVILMTGQATMQSARKALRRGAFDYIRKPFQIDQLKRIVDEAIHEEPISDAPASAEQQPGIETEPLQDMRNRFSMLQDRLSSTCMEAIMAFVAAVEAKDPFTERHSRRVAEYSGELATQLGLAGNEIETIKTAALLHDIGKIGIPDSILTKPGKLTDIEFTLIKEHPDMGVRILESVGFLSDALPLILHHHEWWNGTGYPLGLAGITIPFGARILQTADCIDAMRCRRSYKRSMSIEEITLELEGNAGEQFDPDITVVALDWLHGNPHLESPDMP